jgi:uncharacterized protein YqgC (DUF456 family)
VTPTDLLVALVIAVGLVGIVVPLMPGSVLVVAAVLAWAAAQGGAAAWTVAAVATALVVAGAVVKYVVPTRRLREVGIPARTQWAGVGLAVVGFFVVPVIGLPLGFVLGVYLAELARVGSERAWPATVQSLRAIGLSVLIELAAALLAVGVWVVGVIAT